MNEAQYQQVLRNARGWRLPPLFERREERALLRELGRSARHGEAAIRILEEALPQSVVEGVRIGEVGGVLTVAAEERTAHAALAAIWPRISRELQRRIGGIRRVRLAASSEA